MDGLLSHGQVHDGNMHVPGPDGLPDHLCRPLLASSSPHPEQQACESKTTPLSVPALLLWCERALAQIQPIFDCCVHVRRANHCKYKLTALQNFGHEESSDGLAPPHEKDD